MSVKRVYHKIDEVQGAAVVRSTNPTAISTYGSVDNTVELLPPQ